MAKNLAKYLKDSVNNKRGGGECAHLATAMLQAPKDITKLTGGFVTLYRPVSRYSTPGLIEFTIVNKTLKDRTFKSKIGDTSWETSLTSYDTAQCFKSRSMKFQGSAIPTIGIGSSTVKVKDGSAYEIYLKSDGKVAIQLI